jgi:ribosomal protein S18 acetylase RimI-like enzyme
MVDSDSHSRSDLPRAQRAPDPARSRGILRIAPWPCDPSTIQLLLVDHRVVPSEPELAEIIERIRARGATRIRTGVLFPPAAERCATLGFSTIDSLALLELPRAVLLQTERRVSDDPSVRVAPIRWRHRNQVVAVDQAAFGPIWGYDRHAIRSMRSATPLFRARCVRHHSTVVGYVMAGIGDRTGYIQRLAVAPEHRRAGIARELILDTLGWMKDHSVTSVLVNTGRDNEAALTLYTRLGFEERPEVLTVAELML